MLKIVKLDLFFTAALGRSILIAKFIASSPESEDPLEKNHFSNIYIYIYIYIYNIYII